MSYAKDSAKFAVRLSLYASVLMVSACSSKNSGNPGGVEGAFSSQAVWESPCLDSDRMGLTMQSRFEIEGEAFRRVTQYHSDGSCSSLSVESVEEGTLLRSAANDGSPSGNIDFNYSRIEITPKADPGTLFLNTVSYCGSNTWQVGQTRNVTANSGSDCWDQTPRIVRDIYWVSGHDLYFGVGTEKQKSGSTSRPTAPDQNRIWKIR